MKQVEQVDEYLTAWEFELAWLVEEYSMMNSEVFEREVVCEQRFEMNR